MASQSQGIQQLLQAEKRAAEKVAEARKRKARRLRQAKEEAQAEIEGYRLERERDFQQKQQAALGSRGHVCAEVESQTRRRVQAMQGGQAQGKERVLRQLLGLVCAPHPQLPPNYRPGRLGVSLAPPPAPQLRPQPRPLPAGSTPWLPAPPRTPSCPPTTARAPRGCPWPRPLLPSPAPCLPAPPPGSQLRPTPQLPPNYRPGA